MHAFLPPPHPLYLAFVISPHLVILPGLPLWSTTITDTRCSLSYLGTLSVTHS